MFVIIMTVVLVVVVVEVVMVVVMMLSLHNVKKAPLIYGISLSPPISP